MVIYQFKTSKIYRSTVHKPRFCGCSAKTTMTTCQGGDYDDR